MRLTFLATVTLGCASIHAAPLESYYSSASAPAPFSWNSTNFLLAFGDSWTFIHGTLGRQNYSFIGDAFNTSFTPSQLLNNSITSERFSTSADGANWVQYLTGCFSGLPSNCGKQLWDFAFAGADVSGVFTKPHSNFTVSLVEQVKQWKSYVKDVVKVDVSKALVAFFIGINDVNDSRNFTFPLTNAEGREVTDFEGLYKGMLGQAFTGLDEVWKGGYRQFLVMNLPPLDRLPSVLTAAPGTAAAKPDLTQVNMWNAVLARTAQIYAQTHANTTIRMFDTNSFLNNILDHPSDFGFKNTTGYCKNFNAPDIATAYAKYGCLDLKEYFWYNNGHITSHVHELLAAAVGRFLQSGEGGFSFTGV